MLKHFEDAISIHLVHCYSYEQDRPLRSKTAGLLFLGVAVDFLTSTFHPCFGFMIPASIM